jgi:hypothetical protein
VHVRILLLLTVCAALTVPLWAAARAAEDASMLIEQGNAAWEKRGTDGDPENRAAADAFLAAVEAAPFSYEAHWKAARAIWWIADQRLAATDDKELQRDLGSRGMELAGRAILIAPDSVEGHLYWALSALHYCYGIGMVEALKQGIQDETARHLMMCYDTDRAAEGGIALLGLSALFRTAPWPMRDTDKSVAFAREAAAADPAGIRAAVFLAAALASAGAYGESMELMKRASEMDGDRQREPDCARWKRFAGTCVRKGRVLDPEPLL